jgi:hypothetical protein
MRLRFSFKSRYSALRSVDQFDLCELAGAPYFPQGNVFDVFDDRLA